MKMNLRQARIAGKKLFAAKEAEKAAAARVVMENEKFQNACAKAAQVDVSDLDFESTEFCWHSPTARHVYKWNPQKSRTKGIGSRLCIFCSCDDFDF